MAYLTFDGKMALTAFYMFSWLWYGRQHGLILHSIRVIYNFKDVCWLQNMSSSNDSNLKLRAVKYALPGVHEHRFLDCMQF